MSCCVFSVASRHYFAMREASLPVNGGITQLVDRMHLSPLQTISNVLLSYADIISKLFANYVSMEKVVSAAPLVHTSPLLLYQCS